MDTETCVKGLVEALNADPDYAWGWHCNVAMAAFDEGLDYAAANRAAYRFMYLLGCDMSKNERYAVDACQCAPYDELGIHDFRCPRDALGLAKGTATAAGVEGACPSGLAEAHTLRAEIARRIETFRYAGPLINAEEDAKAAALTKEWESLLAWADAQGERT